MLSVKNRNLNENKTRLFYDVTNNNFEIRDSKKFSGVMSDDEKIEYITYLFNKYSHCLKLYLLKVTQNEDDAAEISQEAFIRLIKHKNLEKIDHRAKKLLFITALNLFRDQIRSNTRRFSFSHVSFDEQNEVANFISPENIAVWSQHISLFEEAVDELPSRARSIFVLHRLKQMSHEKIAKSMDISTRTVERQMATTMSYFRHKLVDIL